MNDVSAILVLRRRTHKEGGFEASNKYTLQIKFGFKVPGSTLATPRYSATMARKTVSRSSSFQTRNLTRPTWVEISLSNLRSNFRHIRQHVGDAVTVCAVVKGDAYGHGAVECAKALEGEGAKWRGVTCLDEAIPLREAGITSRILLMTGFCRGEEDGVIRFDSRRQSGIWLKSNCSRQPPLTYECAVTQSTWK